jgi:hypothetical protein
VELLSGCQSDDWRPAPFLDPSIDHGFGADGTEPIATTERVGNSSPGPVDSVAPIAPDRLGASDRAQGVGSGFVPRYGHFLF